MRSRSASGPWRGSRSNRVRCDPRFEADPSLPTMTNSCPRSASILSLPLEDVPPAPESLDPGEDTGDRARDQSSGDDPEPPPPPPPPPEAVPPVTLPAASFTVPATSSTASLTEPVTPSAASPTLFVRSEALFVRSEACPVGDAAVETAELSVSAGSSWTRAPALPDNPPKTSEAKSRMRVAADVILTKQYPRCRGAKPPESGGYRDPGTATRRELTAGRLTSDLPDGTEVESGDVFQAGLIDVEAGSQGVTSRTKTAC